MNKFTIWLLIAILGISTGCNKEDPILPSPAAPCLWDVPTINYVDSCLTFGTWPLPLPDFTSEESYFGTKTTNLGDTLYYFGYDETTDPVTRLFYQHSLCDNERTILWTDQYHYYPDYSINKQNEILLKSERKLYLFDAQGNITQIEDQHNSEYLYPQWLSDGKRFYVYNRNNLSGSLSVNLILSTEGNILDTLKIEEFFGRYPFNGNRVAGTLRKDGILYLGYVDINTKERTYLFEANADQTLSLGELIWVNDHKLLYMPPKQETIFILDVNNPGVLENIKPQCSNYRFTSPAAVPFSRHYVLIDRQDRVEISPGAAYHLINRPTLLNISTGEQRALVLD